MTKQIRSTITPQRAEEIKAELEKTTKGLLKVTIKEEQGVVVHATAKSITMDGFTLLKIGSLLASNEHINFGRSGANFRAMIFAPAK